MDVDLYRLHKAYNKHIKQGEPLVERQGLAMYACSCGAVCWWAQKGEEINESWREPVKNPNHHVDAGEIWTEHLRRKVTEHFELIDAAERTS